MTPFEAYSTYVALKQHFTRPDYNFKKYNGKLKLTLASFEKRPDKFFFHKLAKRDDVVDYLVANLTHKDRVNTWIGEIVNDSDSENIYKDWLKRKQSLTYSFKKDLEKIDDLQSAMTVPSNGQPPLFKMYLRGEIAIESLIILLSVTRSFRYWSKNMVDDVIWSHHSLLIQKYECFFEFDHDRCEKIIKEKCLQNM